MSKLVAKYINSCKECALSKASLKTKQPMQLTPTPQKPFEIIIMDTIGPFPSTSKGNKYAVTIECDLTKYLVSIPIPNKEAKTIARCVFNSFVLIYGAPQQLRTDLGTEYKNETIKELTKLLNIEHSFTTAYHHESVGTVERNHRIFNEYFRTYASQSDKEWDEWLLYFTFCWNTTPSTLVKDYTPFELVFGRKSNLIEFSKVEPVYNIDNYVNELKYRLQVAQTKARDLLFKYKIRAKEKFDKKCKPLAIKVGEEVYLTNDEGHKLDRVYKGPFIVIKVIEPNCEIKDSNGKSVIVHMNRLKKKL